MQLSDLQQETVSNHILSTKVRVRTAQYQEIQDHNRSQKSGILHNYTTLDQTTDALGRYLEQIQLYNNIPTREE